MSATIIAIWPKGHPRFPKGHMEERACPAFMEATASGPARGHCTTMIHLDSETTWFAPLGGKLVIEAGYGE